jgi:hypothetical protein
MSGHKRVECECGLLLEQCRCPSKDKYVEVVSPCTHGVSLAALEGETGDLQQEEEYQPKHMRSIDG